MQEKPCMICGKLFVGKTIRARMCSEECKLTHHRQKNLENARNRLQREKNTKTTKYRSKDKLTHNQIEAMAREIGMSYGMYVGLMGL